MSAPAKQTLQQKYYAINAALNTFLKSQGARCPVIKFGVDPATLKTASKDQTVSRYPYMQAFILNPKPNAWTSRDAGIYTRFEYQLSFFTSPENELENDEDFFRPFQLARAAFSDVNFGVLLSVDTVTGKSVRIADVLDIREETSFHMVSGAPVPKAVLIVSMAAMCAYPSINIPDPTISTDIDNAWKFQENGAPFT